MPFYQGNTPILLGFSFLLATIGFIFTFYWALFGSVFKSLFSEHAKITNIVMSILLAYCAISLFL